MYQKCLITEKGRYNTKQNTLIIHKFHSEKLSLQHIIKYKGVNWTMVFIWSKYFFFGK